jgi:hypothetical protein
VPLDGRANVGSRLCGVVNVHMLRKVTVEQVADQRRGPLRPSRRRRVITRDDAGERQLRELARLVDG